MVFSETNATPTYSCARLERLECKSIEERLASKRQCFDVIHTRASPPRYLRTPTLTRSHRTSCLCHQNCWTKRRIKIRRPSHQGKRLFSSRFLRLARVIADSWADFTVSVYRFTMGLWKRLSSFQRRE